MKNRHEYPAEWAIEIRPKVLVRDEFRCAECGIRQGTIRPGTMKKVYLVIAHVDHNKSNCEMINLKSLCPSCHCRNDSRHRHIIRLSKAHKNSNTEVIADQLLNSVNSKML